MNWMPQAILSLLLLAGMALPAWAQSQRYPTDREIQGLMQQMRQHTAQLRAEGTYRDRRTPAERQQLAAFVAAWSRIDRSVTPFLGSWDGYEESMLVYPSRTAGQVCIIETYIGDRGTGADFLLGTVRNGRVVLSDNSFLIRQGSYLGVAFVYQNRPSIYEYANPTPLDHPATVSYLKDQPNLVNQFNQAGCRAEPSR